MKLGIYEIKKAFLGDLPLSSRNAFVGIYNVIKDAPIAGWEGLKITSLEDANDVTVNVSANTGTSSKIYALYTSLDEGRHWTTEFDTQLNKTITYTLNAGDTLCVKADANRWQYASSNKGSSIKSTKKVNISGNIMSLLYNDDFSDKVVFKSTADRYTFGYLFSGCKVVDASELILAATTLIERCYYNMFYGCTSLVNAPELPATTLAVYCYSDMFSGCKSLQNAPTLHPMTFADHCCYRMFYNCSGLTTAPELPAMTLASYCYSNMFEGCTGLTTAPELPATILATRCYGNMFLGCTSLENAPVLPAQAYNALKDYCYSNMFKGCTSLKIAPELPSTSYGLAISAYDSMFSGCSSLVEVTTYVKSWNTTATNNWLSGVSSTGTLYNLGNAADIPTDDASGCPTGWTIKTSKGIAIPDGPAIDETDAA